MIKAQILAGGRGMGKFDSGLKGGVHICSRYVTKCPACSSLTIKVQESPGLVCLETKGFFNFTCA